MIDDAYGKWPSAVNAGNTTQAGPERPALRDLEQRMEKSIDKMAGISRTPSASAAPCAITELPPPPW